MRRQHRTFCGFTIIEMMVVIGIIALLLAMLLPVVAGAKRRAMKTEEMNYIRQVGTGWVLYSNSNNDAALPGHLSPGTQERWRVTYKYIDGSKVPPGDSLPTVTPPEPFDVDNEDNIAGPWTFRLLPYLQNNYEIAQFYSNDAIRDDLQVVQDAKDISQHPSFAYNGYYIGGVYHRVNLRDPDTGDNIDLAAPRFNWATYRDYDGYVAPANVISRSVSSISRAAQVITFCSAAPMPKGQFRQVDPTTPGGHLVHPPYLARERQWGPSSGLNDWGGGGGGGGPGGAGGGGGPNVPGGGGGGGGIAKGDVGGRYEVFAEGATVPIGRYTDLAVVLYADNHVEQAQPLSLFDQTKWINSASQKIWVHEEGSVP